MYVDDLQLTFLNTSSPHSAVAPTPMRLLRRNVLGLYTAIKSRLCYYVGRNRHTTAAPICHTLYPTAISKAWQIVILAIYPVTPVHPLIIPSPNQVHRG